MRELGIEHVIAVGELARAYGGEWVADADGRGGAPAGSAAPRRRRARQGLALGGTRGRRGELEQLMARVLVAALVAMIIAILSGPTFIGFLRKNEFGQHIREEGPQTHLAKQGTPTMGGLLILLAADDRVPAALRLHAPGAHGLRHGRRVRRDRLPRRLHQAAPQALARPTRALEDADAARDHRRGRRSPRTTSISRTTSTCRSRTSRSRSGRSGTGCCS